MGKVYPVGDNVWASLEMLIDPIEDFPKFFPPVTPDPERMYHAFQRKYEQSHRNAITYPEACDTASAFTSRAGICTSRSTTASSLS